MWYHPAAFAVGRRDVIGGWLVCLVVAAASFGTPLVTAAVDGLRHPVPVAAAPCLARVAAG